MLTSPGEARPAPAELTMAKAAKAAVLGEAAIPAAPALAHNAVAMTRLRGRRDATKKPTIAPRQYITDAPEEINPAAAAVNDSSAWTSGRNSP